MTIASRISYGNYTAATAETVTSSNQPNIASIGTLSNLVVSSNVTSGNLTFAGTVTGGAIKYMFESANIVASSPPATTDIDVIDGAIQYWTSNATTNITANIRGNIFTPLNSVLAIGQSSTIALIVPQATAYYVSAVKVDNATVTPVWQGGSTVAVGNANSIDLYTFTVIKTANATFKVFASQTKYQHTG